MGNLPGMSSKQPRVCPRLCPREAQHRQLSPTPDKIEPSSRWHSIRFAEALGLDRYARFGIKRSEKLEESKMWKRMTPCLMVLAALPAARSQAPLASTVRANAVATVAFTEGPTVDAEGNVYFSEIFSGRVGLSREEQSYQRTDL
jgi:hypothetical protein